MIINRKNNNLLQLVSSDQSLQSGFPSHSLFWLRQSPLSHTCSLAEHPTESTDDELRGITDVRRIASMKVLGDLPTLPTNNIFNVPWCDWDPVSCLEAWSAIRMIKKSICKSYCKGHFKICPTIWHEGISPHQSKIHAHHLDKYHMKFHPSNQGSHSSRHTAEKS